MKFLSTNRQLRNTDYDSRSNPYLFYFIEPVLVNFADTNTSLEVLNSSNNRDDSSSSTFPLRPRPIKSYPHSFSHLTSSTYNLLSTTNSSKSTPNDDDTASITIPITSKYAMIYLFLEISRIISVV